METKSTSVSIPDSDELIEVRKPTSLLIAQFFLFPLIIIAICIGIFLLFGYMTYQQTTPQEYLNEVRTGSDHQRWQAAYELSNVITSQKDKLRSTDFVNELIKVYQGSREGDPRIRRYLALTMGHLGDTRAVPVLIEGLNDTDAENQMNDLLALGSIGDKSATPVVVQRLSSPDPAMRKMAAFVLTALKDPSAVRGLQVALNDTSDEVRWYAAIALAQVNDASGTDVLMQLTDHGYLDKLQGYTPEQKSQLVINAVKCLGILKFQPAKDRILALSQSDPDLAVRDASLEALKQLS
ncbi:MAG TPA: HEAT repeat domain-containing protein [Terriglobia bacterium]|nr:HEAT repeat domain-containing protein [Terriglobia bacterium]